MQDFPLTIRKQLQKIAEPNYRDFATSLIPNCNNLLGVRLPLLRKIAKNVLSQIPVREIPTYLNAPELYFEEVMLKGMLIGGLKTNITTLHSYMVIFIPKINNWSTCDSFCCGLKKLKNHLPSTWKFIQPYINSNEPFQIRTALIILLNHFITDEYLDKIFHITKNITNNNYYVIMGASWLIATCYEKFPTETLKLLNDNTLPIAIHNKAIQKICESRHTNKEAKLHFKTLKRK